MLNKCVTVSFIFKGEICYLSLGLVFKVIKAKERENSKIYELTINRVLVFVYIVYE